jgi:hypothetical protein
MFPKLYPPLRQRGTSVLEHFLKLIHKLKRPIDSILLLYIKIWKLYSLDMLHPFYDLIVQIISTILGVPKTLLSLSIKSE